ncbi:DASH complex subunit ask1 [Mortierella sp. GBA30]|nr:DASH complex subunit ask1 [Mortierella sp. GBA30]
MFTPPVMSTEDVLDEIERLDQSITRTLLEIDQSFSNCQIIVSSKILPQIDRYADSSAEVWKNARVWLNFFEAANAPPVPVPGRRAQAVRNAMNKHRVAISESTGASGSAASNGPLAIAGTDSTTPEYSIRHQSRHDDIMDNSTNRPRISLSTERLSSNFMGSSADESMPSTPTPLHSKRDSRHQQEDMAPSAPSRWNQYEGHAKTNDNNALNQSAGTTTPNRPRYQYNRDALERASTTPTITLKDRPMPLSHYTQPAATAKSPATSTGEDQYRSRQSTEREKRGSTDGGFLELDVEENHQDVITPPSTLHFSIPESKLAGTPRSVVAKSLVDKIRMKDGLVIPQPIFVNDDDEDDAVVMESYVGSGEADKTRTETAEELVSIGGSKKRNRDGDLLDQDIEGSRDGGRSQSWASLTEQQRNRERLLKSPRKMASVQDFFEASVSATPKSTSSAPTHGTVADDEDNSDGSQSPSRQLISQIQSQADPTEVDPLLAALATPPEVRKKIQEHKARYSIVQRPVPAPATLSSANAMSFSAAPTPTLAAPATTDTITTTATTTTTTRAATAATTIAAAARFRVEITSSTATAPSSLLTPLISATAGNNASLLTAAPVGTTAVDNPTVKNARNTIDTIFKESFNTGFASSANNRRQTMATPVDSSRNQYSTNSILSSSRGMGGSVRNSVGPGFSSFMTPSPFAGASRAGIPAGSASSRLSLLGSPGFRKPMRPTSPSPASRAAANAIASATAGASAVPSTVAGTAASEYQQTITHTSQLTQSGRSNGVTRLVQPSGMGRFSIGDSGFGLMTGTRVSATPIVSTATFLAQVQDEQQQRATMSRDSGGKAVQDAPHSDLSSRGSQTPFTLRDPPPAPRLGYHSDTMMTQSSLGLNHDGFGYDSEDRTRMTIASSGGASVITMSSQERTSMSASATTAAGEVNAPVERRRRIEDEIEYGDDEGEEDDDVTGNIMRSPCPPGRAGSTPFLGSRTDLKSVAQAATAKPAGGRMSVLGRPSLTSTSAPMGGNGGTSGGPGLFKR